MTRVSVEPAVTGMVTTTRWRGRGALLAWLVLLLATGGCSFRSSNRGIEFLGTEDVILQRGHTDCGMAALATLSLLLGTPKALDELEIGMPFERELSMLDVRNVAARQGIVLRGVFTRPTGSTRLPTPWIAHFETPAHYVVVTSSDGSDWIVADPAAGVFRYTDEALRRRWSGRALIVTGSIRGGSGQQPIDPPSSPRIP
jgi:ABC-type bacteriocin/lantibiotic exporter with double-glycine peptidase domain